MSLLVAFLPGSEVTSVIVVLGLTLTRYRMNIVSAIYRSNQIREPVASTSHNIRKRMNAVNGLPASSTTDVRGIGTASIACMAWLTILEGHELLRHFGLFREKPRDCLRAFLLVVILGIECEMLERPEESTERNEQIVLFT